MADPQVQTGGSGAIFVGKQTVRETQQDTGKWLGYATAVDIQPIQNAILIPPTVGSRLFPRAGAKSGYLVAGGFTLFALDADNLSDLLSGLHPGGGNDAALPWFTIKRRIGEYRTETFVDCRIDTAALNFVGGGVASGTFSFIGRTGSDAAAATGDPGTVEGDVLVTAVSGGVATIGGTAYPATSVVLTFNNGLRRNLQVIGSQVLYDVPPTVRTVRAAYASMIQKTGGNVYDSIYWSSGAWTPSPLAAALVVTAQNAAGTKQLSLNIPEVQWLAAPLVITPDVIEYVAAGDLTVSGATAAWTLTYGAV